MEWHNYKHLDWISVRRDDDKIYTFKEGHLKRLRIQDIEDMLLLLIQGKLSNLTVEEHFAFNVSLRMFMRSIVIQRHVEDLQLGVESYQKRLNLTRPDTYRSDLKRHEADGTLNDVRNALDDRLKEIRMQQEESWEAWKDLLVDDSMRETSGCYKGPYDLSYTAPTFNEFALLVRLSMTEHFLEQLAKFCSSHDLVLVVSLTGKTIQDAERFEQWVDLRHLFQTPDVRVPPSDRTMATTLEQHVALDEALVSSAQRLRIRQMTADVPEIYMQELWATAKLHQHSIHFKMDTRKHVLDLEAFREMLHISPRIPGQSFAELPFEEEILEFLRSNVDYAYLIWEDFMYQVEHKNQKKSNEMYYPRFTKVIIDYFMTRKPSIPRRNRVNWHYVRDDLLFSTIKVVSRHQTTQQYDAILPIELTTDDIRNIKAYKEYYACATGEAAPKPKASARKKKGGSASSTTPPTPIATPTPTTTIVAAPRLSAAAKEEELSWNSSDDEDVDEQTKGREESKGDKTDESDNDDDNQDEAEKVNDDDDDEEEISKIGEHEVTESDEGDDEATKSDRESEDEETKEQEEESMESIFMTGSTTVTLIPSPQSTMTPS
nr:hypothetical protein [Tanacetum cinerariifolium]